MEQTGYGFKTSLSLSFEKAVEKTKARLKQEGFGILTEIDVKEKLKEKLGKEFRDYLILGACHPASAYQALTAELEVGLLLPCNVIVYQANEGTVVAAINPMEAMKIAANPELAGLAKEVSARLKTVIASLGGDSS